MEAKAVEDRVDSEDVQKKMCSSCYTSVVLAYHPVMQTGDQQGLMDGCLGTQIV